jgi:small conductance mechanosensitive channel
VAADPRVELDQRDGAGVVQAPEVVDVGEASGTVEAVSLRTARLRADRRHLWHVPNGQINRVGNMSQHWSRARLDIEVAYDTVVDHARTVIKRVADTVWHKDDGVLEEPELWGVEQLGAHGVVMRLVVKTTPSQQWRISATCASASRRRSTRRGSRSRSRSRPSGTAPR